MELEAMTRRQSVREGYVVLLRAEAEILLPKDPFLSMRSFYEKVSEACLNWVTEIYGEELRRHFLSLSDVREKSRFRTQYYRFWMRIPWQEMPHITILCESERTSLDGTRDFYRICHTWNTEEQTMLPFGQILQLFGFKLAKNEMPFVPDGIFKENDRIVIFQNRTSKNNFLEAKLPFPDP